MSRSVSSQGGNDDARSFKDLLLRLNIGEALFLPIERSAWHEDQFVLDPGTKHRPEISGARLYAWDPQQPSGPRERECQTDLGDLVRALRKLRSEPGWESVVLSKNHARGQQPGVEAGRRVRFGLERGKGGRTDDAAARRCHRRIIQAIQKSGFKVEYPQRFDSHSGMAGLEEWAGSVRLCPRWRPPAWLLLLPLLLLFLLVFLFLVPWRYGPANWAGIPVDTDFVVIVDRSTSMTKSFPNVRQETKRLLYEMRGRHASLIFFAAAAESVWGELRPLTDDAVRELANQLDVLRPKGSTNLQSAINQAAREILKHKKPTTLLMLTDGEDDPSVQYMVDHLQEVKDRFGGVEVVVHATTPRLLPPAGAGAPNLSPPPSTQPVNREEENLAKLCHFFNGQFGPSRPLK